MGNGCCTIDAAKLTPAKLVVGGRAMYRPATICEVYQSAQWVTCVLSLSYPKKNSVR